MAEFLIYKSRKMAFKVILGILVHGIGAIGFYQNDSFLLMGLCLLVFIAGIIFGLYDLLDTRPRIIINEIGIFDRSINYPIINWELIHDAYIGNAVGGEAIYFDVDVRYEPAYKKSKLWWKINRWAFDDSELMQLNINLHGIEVDPDKLLTLIKSIIKLKHSTNEQKVKVIEDWNRLI